MMPQENVIWRPPEKKVRKFFRKGFSVLGFVFGALVLSATDNPDPNYVGHGDVIGAVILVFLAGFFFSLSHILKGD